MMNTSFGQRRALVTYAGRGIGRALARKLVECDAIVIAFCETKEHSDSLKEELPQIETHVVDLSDWNETKRVTEQLEPVELLVNNAGCVECAPTGKITEAEIDRQFNVNFKAVVNISHEISQGMIKAGKRGCSIVNISSKSSTAAVKDLVIYSATKAAVDQITRAMAVELGKYQIRVNAVNPTAVLNEFGDRAVFCDPIKAKNMKDRIPLCRFAEVKDVVNAVIYLLSDKADMINGVCVPVDGGFVAC